MVRDLPPHLPLFNILKIEVPEELTPDANPVYEDEVLDKLHSLCQTENLPGLFALRHVSQAAAKDRIIKAQELAYAYLHRAKLRQTVKLSRAILKKPKIFEVISLLENLFKEFRILHDYEEIKAFSPKPEVLASIGKKLSNLREDMRDYLVGNGMAVPKPPLWGKNNNPEEWWSTNDFEILSAAY
jgi:hypothetical protein